MMQPACSSHFALKLSPGRITPDWLPAKPCPLPRPRVRIPILLSSFNGAVPTDLEALRR